MMGDQCERQIEMVVHPQISIYCRKRRSFLQGKQYFGFRRKNRNYR